MTIGRPRSKTAVSRTTIVSGVSFVICTSHIRERDAAYAALLLFAIFIAFVAPFEVALAFECVRGRLAFVLHFAAFAFGFAASDTP